MKKLTLTILAILSVTAAMAQSVLDLQPKLTTQTSPKKQADVDPGVVARLKDIARFRGVRSNHLVGTGLVLGLEGTGDTKKIGAMTSALAAYLRRQNLDVDLANLEPRNVALVSVTVELPPFATSGQRLDATVTSIGDAKSLRNGVLVLTELTRPGDTSTVFATAAGPISVGGFGVGAGGNSQTKGFLTVGRIPGGATVEQGAGTTIVHDGNKMFLELDEPDVTTAHRTEERINANAPNFHATAINGSTIEITIPEGMNQTAAMARIEEITIPTDQVAMIIVNERTGTIVMGGSVKIAPVAFMYGSISIRVEETQFVSQPLPLSDGTTVKGSNKKTGVDESTVQTGVTQPNTTVADLAAIFQSLKLSAGDVIAILQSLRQQGALKARLVLQ